MKLSSFVFVVGSLLLVSCSSPISPSDSEDSNSTIVVPSSLTLGKEDIIDFSNGTLDKDGIVFTFTNAKENAEGFVIFEKAGYITNKTPFSKTIVSINVVFSTTVDYGVLATRSSAYPISSPMNGAYELVSGTDYVYPNSGQYFSVYAPLYEYAIESITLHFGDDYVKPQSDPDVIDFYTINDTHGASDMIYESKKYQSGIKKLSSFLVGQERKSPETTIVLSSGDMWQGGAQSNLTRGKSMVDWMNVAGFESMAIGNHEFDWTPSVIAENSSFANFPFLGINITDAEGNRPSWAKPSCVVHRGKYNVGVIGAIGPVENSIATATRGGYVFNWGKAAKLISDEAKRLRSEENCDIVVLSLHYSGGDDPSSSNILTFAGVDAIFEGHSHRCYSFLDNNNVPHVQTYANGSDIQHVQFKVSPNTGKLIFDHYNDITIETITSLEDEPMATKVYDHYESEVAVVKNEVIYTSSSQISKNELAKFAVKSLYDFYAERYQDDERPLVGAVINSGGVRQVLPAGNITYGDLLAALPFENDNVEVAMTLTNAETFSNNYVGYMTDVSSLSSSSEVRMITLSYLSDGPYVGQYNFTELSRDGLNFLKDIVAQAFRDGKYGG